MRDLAKSSLANMVTNAILMTMKPKSTTMGAGEFKAKCLSVLDEVERGRRTVIVTKRGRPVAQVVPLPASAGSTLEGSLLHDEEPFTPVAVSWKAGA